MSAIGIDISDYEKEISFNQPSGRSNLVGQRKPDYLLKAIEAEESAYDAFSHFENECILAGRTSEEYAEIRRLEAVWLESQRKRAAAYRFWNNSFVDHVYIIANVDAEVRI